VVAAVACAVGERGEGATIEQAAEVAAALADLPTEPVMFDRIATAI
jgi:hypothetical protein